jgi:glycopeptide antibiotics resistance protein
VPRTSSSSLRITLPVPARYWITVTWLFTVVLWLTWTPTGTGGPELYLGLLTGFGVILGNVLLFAPIAFVLAATRAPTHHGKPGRRRLVLETAGVVALLSLTVELGQLLVPGRSTSPADFLVNTGGGALAAWFALELVRRGARPTALAAGAGVVVFAGVIVFLSATGFSFSRMIRLESWRPQYQVVAGDEAGGGRPYAGIVTEARICAGRPDAAICVEPGAEEAQRADITDLAVRTQRVVLSAVVNSSAPQGSRARIVTFSLDPSDRNATLTQDGRSLIFRFRTPLTGPNGTRLEVELPNAVREGSSTRVMASYEPGRIQIAASDGTNDLHGRLTWGLLTSWWLGRGAMRLTDNVVARFHALPAGVAAASFGVPIGIAAARLRNVRRWLPLIVAGLAPPALLLGLVAGLAIPFSPLEAILCAGFGLLGALLQRYADRLSVAAPVFDTQH